MVVPGGWVVASPVAPRSALPEPEQLDRLQAAVQHAQAGCACLARASGGG